MDSLITLAYISDANEASIIKSYLQANGVESITIDGLTNNTFGGSIVIPVEIKIYAEDLEKAEYLRKEGGFGKYLADE